MNHLASEQAKTELELTVLKDIETYKFPVWNPDRSGSYHCPQIWELEAYLLGLEQTGEIKVFQEVAGGKGAQYFSLQIRFSGPVFQREIDETLQKRFGATKENASGSFEPYNYGRD